MPLIEPTRHQTGTAGRSDHHVKMSPRLACLLAACLVLASATTDCLAGPLPASDGAIDIPTPPPSPFDIDTIWVPLLLSYAAYCPEWSLAAMECNYCQVCAVSVSVFGVWVLGVSDVCLRARASRRP